MAHGRLLMMVLIPAYNQTILDTDIAMSKQQFDVNYWGVLSTTQQFFPLLRKGKGTIVNIGSGVNLVPGPYASAYRSTKAAVEVLSHAMRMEMEPFGLHVVHVSRPLPFTNPVYVPIPHKSGLEANKIKATLGFVLTRLQDKAPASGNIPEASLYTPIKDRVEAYLKIFSPTISSYVFAQRFVPLILKKNPPTVVYDGGGIGLTRTLGALGSIFGPRTFDWAWGFMDGLPELRKIVAAQEQDEKDKSV